MTRRETEKVLHENGFQFLRDGGRHILFSDGHSIIAVHKGSKNLHYAELQMRSNIRRAIEKRERERERMQNSYECSKIYRGFNGVMVFLERVPNTRSKWSISFSPTSRLEFVCKSKFHALLFAAHKCRFSGKRMNFSPVREC